MKMDPLCETIRDVNPDPPQPRPGPNLRSFLNALHTRIPSVRHLGSLWTRPCHFRHPPFKDVFNGFFSGVWVGFGVLVVFWRIEMVLGGSPPGAIISSACCGSQVQEELALFGNECGLAFICCGTDFGTPSSHYSLTHRGYIFRIPE